MIRPTGSLHHRHWSSPLHPPLRVGILVDSLEPAAWVRRILEEIAASDCARLVLVVHNRAEPPSLRQQIVAYRGQLLPLLFDRLDAWLTRRWRRPDAFARASIEHLLLGCARVDVRPRQTRFSDYFSDDDLAAIRASDLDVALRFGFRILRGGALEIARHGVWSFHHGDSEIRRGGPNSFWEVMQAEPATGAVLQVLSDELDAGRVLARTWSATNHRSLSLSRNPHYWKAAALVGRALRDLQQRNSPLTVEPASSQPFSVYDRPLYTRPGNLASLPILGRFGARNLAHLTAKLTGEARWLPFVALGSGDRPAASLHRFRPLQLPADCDWRDPFPLEQAGRRLLFLAERQRRARSASLVVVDLTTSDTAGSRQTLLSGGPDLGYPCIVRWNDELLMTPNQPGRSGLTIYRCRSFPAEWELVATLLEGRRCGNPTLAEVEGRWWLFVNLAVEGGSLDDELHLYWADAPLGPWQAHPRNPIRSDVRAARPGGRLFHFNRRLYRPAQDRASGPRRPIRLFEVSELSTTAYREREAAIISPLWRPDLVAARTFNHDGGVTAIDGAIRAVRWRRYR